MGAIEDLLIVKPFNAGQAYSNTAQYRSVKRDLEDIAGRLQALIANMGIVGNTADAIDESLTVLVEQIRERADNVNQLSDARNTATRGGDTAAKRAATLGPQVETARAMMMSPDAATMTAGEMLYQRLEIEANGAIAALGIQTSQAIGELPTVFQSSDPVSQGSGSSHSANRSPAKGNSTPHSTLSPATIRNSATNWMPQQPDPSQPMNAGSRASYNASPATPQGTFEPATQASFQATPNPGAVGQEVAAPVNNQFQTSQATAQVTPNVTPHDGFVANAAPFEPTQNGGFGVAKAAAGAAALPAMAKAVSRASQAISGNARGATARGASAANPARGATPRTGAAPRAGARSGAATRASAATSKSGLAPRPGQGAATRAATPARGGASAAKGAGARTASGANPARGATGSCLLSQSRCAEVYKSQRWRIRRQGSGCSHRLRSKSCSWSDRCRAPRSSSLGKHGQGRPGKVRHDQGRLYRQGRCR
ncbi:hypothetical protein [Flaviflexus massiliensis]|uniref:hypothetical protein n=1 Tax=Flaviflexus massiliensis TaxID=1522309 RepID=UPI0006D55402|nr:hypothetical protein [Flaviflexus massiliensis]